MQSQVSSCPEDIFGELVKWGKEITLHHPRYTVDCDWLKLKDVCSLEGKL